MPKPDAAKKILLIVGIIILVSVFFRSSQGGGGAIMVFLLIMILFVYKFFKKISQRLADESVSDSREKVNLGNINNKIINSNFMATIKSKALLIIAVVIVLVIIANGIVIIPAGTTGVYHLFGKVKDGELQSGIHLINPLANVTEMSIRTEEYTMSILQEEGTRSNNDTIAALTKEGLSVDLDITVLFHLIEDKASDVYKNLGIDYSEKIIRPEIRSAIREVVAVYEVKDIYSDKRQEAAIKILSALQGKLEPRGITVEDVLLRNVGLPEGLAKSIQEKLSAEQEAQKYDFVLEKERKEKERKLIEAEGQKAAQVIINEGLTSKYLQYLYIQQLKDLKGTIYIPTSPDSGLPMFKGIE